MTQLQLAPFFGLDIAQLAQDQLDSVRHEFAHTIAQYAAQCASSHELLQGIALASPPESGLPLPRVLGEGSTRRTWSLPFGLVMKLERADSLSAFEMSLRGSRDYLQRRRRTALVGEVGISVSLPQLMPRIYDLLFAFGNRPPHPSVLITETLTPLDQLRPGETEGIPHERIFVSSTTGELLVVDPRFPTLRAPGPEDRNLSEYTHPRESAVWLGNIGVNTAGRCYLIDGGNYRHELFDNDTPDYTPVIRAAGMHQWEPCDPNSPAHIRQTRIVSAQVLTVYRSLLARSEGRALEALQAA